MEHDHPLATATPPDRAAPTHPFALLQGVGEQISIRPECAAVEVAGFPDVFGGIGDAVFEYVEDVGATVALAGGADFPEVGAGVAEFGAMEDRLAPTQFIEHAGQFGRGSEIGFHRGLHRIQFYGSAAFHADYPGGCHSSIRVPSGSVIQPKRPNSLWSTRSSTSTPSARSCASSASRSSTRKLIMYGCGPGPK